MASEGLPALVACLAAGAVAAAPRSSQEAAAASAKELARMASLGTDQAQRLAEEPGALPALVAAVAAGRGAAVPCSQASAAASSATVLSLIAMADPGIAVCIAKEPGALAALLAAVARGVPDGLATNSANALFWISVAGRDAAARMIAEDPGALPALVAAVAAGTDAGVPGSQDGMAAHIANVLLCCSSYGGSGITARVAEVPGALPLVLVLVAAVTDGGDAAPDCMAALAQITAASPQLARRVGQAPGALAAVVAAAAGGGAAAAPTSLQQMAESGASALFFIIMADPGLARRVSRVPGALPALVAAVTAGGAASRSCCTVLTIVLRERPAAFEAGLLPALVAAVAAGGAAATPREREAAVNSACALGGIAAADPGLARCVAGVPGALAALGAAAAAGGDAGEQSTGAG